jgi:hypothetical protein
VLTAGDALSSVDKAFITSIGRFASIIDVYSLSFADTVIMKTITGSPPEGLLAQFEASGRFSVVYHTLLSSLPNVLLRGPYFLSMGSIHQVYCLDKDDLDSFIFCRDPRRHLEGTQLTMMSRPWTGLCGPDEESAE